MTRKLETLVTYLALCAAILAAGAAVIWSYIG